MVRAVGEGVARDQRGRRCAEELRGSNTVTRNVWSPVYVDGLVLRDRDTDANGTLDERLYSMQDANWNTTALVSISGCAEGRTGHWQQEQP